MTLTASVGRLALACGVISAMFVPLTAGGTRAAQAAGSAYVRVLHASPDAPAVEVFVDGAKAVKSLAYPQATTFLSVPAGTHHIQVFPAGARYSAKGGVINATVPFKANVHYTVAAVGPLKAITARVFTDATSAGKTTASVSFLHLSPTAPAVDIEAKGAGLIFKHVSFPDSAMAPVRVPSGTYTLLVHPAGKDTVTVLTVRGVHLTAGQEYTVAAIGLLNGMGAQKLSATVLNDTPMKVSGM